MLLRQLGQQMCGVVQRSAAPAARIRVDREVHPGRHQHRLGKPVGQRCLHRYVLEVDCSGVKEQRLFTIVDRHLAQDSSEQPEPERLSHPLPNHCTFSLVQDIPRGAPAQMTYEDEVADVSHDKLHCRRSDDKLVRS